MGAKSSESDKGAYCFGNYRLVPHRQLLLRGDAPVKIGTRAIDLLRFLVTRPGEVVSKAELIAAAWPDIFVHEGNLKVNIAALRKALSQDPGEPPFIATITGRGYRFVAPVRREVDGHPALPARTVDDADLPAPRHIVGRGDDIDALVAKIGEAGFVTIVGPAGVGKTTLAVAAARRLADRHADGICFVDLATVNDPQLVRAAIATALGSGLGVVDLLVGIVETLRGQSRLLILDNCEHVLSACALIAEHLRAALPDTTIIATSREAFRSQSEVVYRLPPLRCPENDARIDSAAALAFSAVELFVARAHEAAGYRLSDADVPVVAEICRRLDGIPLAMELAAPRLKTYDPATLLQLLNQGLDLLSHGSRNAPLRHQALLTTLDWSYRLLSDGEASLLRLLSVFVGAFTLEDVLGIAHGASPTEVAACLDNLVAKSLVAQAFTDSGVRYRLLDTTRSYAGERLRAAGEQRGAADRHAGYLERLFERAEAEWQWRPSEEWIATYGRRANDLRKAIDWAFGEGGAPEVGLRLTAAALPLWDELSSVGESRQRVRIALAAAQAMAQCDPLVRMKLATAHARGLTFGERLEPEAEAACLESLRLARVAGDAEYQLRAVWHLAVLQSFAGRHLQALTSLDLFDAIAGQDSDGSAALASERFRLMTAFYRGEIAGAHEGLKQLLKRHAKPAQHACLSRFQADPHVLIRVSLAFVGWVRGDSAAAARTAGAAMERARSLGHLVSQSNALALAAIPIALWTGDLDKAERYVALLLDNLNQKDLASWAPLSRFFAAAIRHRRGDAEAVEQMRIAVDDILASAFLIRLPLYLGMLAEAALERGRADLARSSIVAAFAHAEQQDERWCQPDLLRILGQVEWSEGDRDQAEQSLLRAVATAAGSGAVSFELRAACDLADRWAATGRAPEAVALLEPLCRRSGAETATGDAAHARRLLEQVRGQASFGRLRTAKGA